MLFAQKTHTSLGTRRTEHEAALQSPAVEGTRVIGVSVAWHRRAWLKFRGVKLEARVVREWQREAREARCMA